MVLDPSARTRALKQLKFVYHYHFNKYSHSVMLLSALHLSYVPSVLSQRRDRGGKTENSLIQTNRKHLEICIVHSMLHNICLVRLQLDARCLVEMPA